MQPQDRSSPVYFDMENTTNSDIFVRAQGRAAMMGFITICLVYAISGQIIPGVV